MKHIYDQSQFGEDWFTYPNLYSNIVKKFPSGSKFVEVGCWKGKSSSYMAVEIVNSHKQIDFYCVDTWGGSKEHLGGNLDLENLYKTFLDNMEPVKEFYVPVKMSSIEASKIFEDKSLDFVFLDASHEYEDVKEDIQHWLPKIKSGGIFAGHDYDPFWGVYQAVNELLPNVDKSEQCWIYNVV